MNVTSPAQSKCLGMALLGGGVRAGAFHAGVLKWLALSNNRWPLL